MTVPLDNPSWARRWSCLQPKDLQQQTSIIQLHANTCNYNYMQLQLHQQHAATPTQKHDVQLRQVLPSGMLSLEYMLWYMSFACISYIEVHTLQMHAQTNYTLLHTHALNKHSTCLGDLWQCGFQQWLHLAGELAWFKNSGHVGLNMASLGFCHIDLIKQ